MDDEAKKVANSSSAAAAARPDVTVEAAAVEMRAAAEWSPSPTATSSSDEDDVDDTLPHDDLEFARAVAREGLIKSSFCHFLRQYGLRFTISIEFDL